MNAMLNAPLAERVDHPLHYGGDTRYETIKVIEAWGLGFCLGNALKYVSRAGKKDPAATSEDLCKALWYLRRHLAGVRQPSIAVEAFWMVLEFFELGWRWDSYGWRRPKEYRGREVVRAWQLTGHLGGVVMGISEAAAAASPMLHLEALEEAEQRLQMDIHRRQAVAA